MTRFGYPITATALASLGLIFAGCAGAQAQVQLPGWYGSIQGAYWLDSGNDHATEIGGGGTTYALQPEDGWGGNAKIGYRFAPMPIDIAIGGAYASLPNGKTGYVLGQPGREKARYWAADFELGYTLEFAGGAVRPFVGARYADWKHTTRYGIGCVAGCFTRHVDTEVVGPRLGFDGTVRLFQSIVLFGGASAAALFGDVDGSWPVQSAPTPGKKRDRTVWNYEGQVGLGWEVAPLVTIAAGYRAEFWDGVTDRNLTGAVPPFATSKSQDRVLHGPFVRVSYNIGAPRAAAPAPVAPAPAAVMTKNFIVFFDFDRSNLTAQAQNTVREAAAASKTGGVQRVNVTGHADKSGGDAYNMALSLRRANTVRDELVRNGVPANAIVVVARGESQPLVPTADGVREPQNRRVEIVLQ